MSRRGGPIRKPAPVRPNPAAQLKPVTSSSHIPGMSGFQVKSGPLAVASSQPPDYLRREGPIVDAPEPPVPISSCRADHACELIALPALGTALNVEIPQLAFQKLKQCNRMCDFSDPELDVQSKYAKASALTELIACYSTPKQLAKLTRECHQQVIDVFATNVFRSMPKIPAALLEADEACMEDVAWPHLQLVYRLFLQFLESQVDHRLLQFHLTPKYLASLFALLDFPDRRERIQVKNVIASIFQNVPPHRAFLRVLTQNMLAGVCDGVFLNAAWHLLELFHLFTINTLPPLSAHMIFAFERVLLPLHLPYKSHRYFQPLIRCTLLFVRKDVRLGTGLLKFLMDHWPMTFEFKAQLFIDEVTQLLEDAFGSVEAQICDLLLYISMALESPSMSLGLRAIAFLTENNFQNLYKKDPVPMLKIIFPALYHVAEGHWKRRVQQEAMKVMKTFMDLDPRAFRQVATSFKDSIQAERTQKLKMKQFWEGVVTAAAAKNQELKAHDLMADLDDFYGEGKGCCALTQRSLVNRASARPKVEDDDEVIPEPAVEDDGAGEEEQLLEPEKPTEVVAESEDSAG